MSNTNDYTKAVAAFLLPERAAFSLVEMLMALLVASLLLAALAPVVTKKFNENVSIFGAGGGGGSSDSDSTEEIQAKIAALQSQLQAALSGGNTSKASSLQAQIAALQAQVQSAA